mgnify:CR=1 FL=1
MGQVTKGLIVIQDEPAPPSHDHFWDYALYGANIGVVFFEIYVIIKCLTGD